MKRFSILCCLVLLLNVLCPVGHVHAEDITTPTDLCNHTNTGLNSDSTHHWLYCYDCWTDSINKAEHTFELKYNENRHWQECSVCGYTRSSTSHQALCTNPGVCKDCGYEDADMYAPHTDGYWADGNLCVYGCVNCKEEYWLNDHYADCATPGVCKNCGATGNFELSHHNETINTDPAGHYSECTVCHTKGTVSKHYASCRTPDVCESCGYTGTIEKLSHRYRTVSDGADGHHEECTICGDAQKIEKHYAYCSDPTRCRSCGYVGEISDVWCTGDSIYVSDGAKGHHYECSTCGKKGSINSHTADCSDPTHCRSCGYEGEIKNLNHDDDCISDGAKGHHYECSICGYKGSINSHTADCSDPTHCTSCDYEGEIKNLNHDSDCISDGAKGHHYVCSICGYKGSINSHTADCSDPTHCMYCGYEGEIKNLEHNNDHISDGAKGHHDKCSICGQETDVTQHTSNCLNPSRCFACGYEGEINLVFHNNDYISDGSAGHHTVCSNCGEVSAVSRHTANCTNPTRCIECGYESSTLPDENTFVSHTGSGKYSHDETQHWFTCKACKQVVYEVHYVSVSANARCYICGATVTIDTKNDEANSGDTNNSETAHNWVIVEQQASTCTTDGFRHSQCSICGQEKTVTFSAHHVYDVYTPADNGTHTQTCTRCGHVVTSACTMVETSSDVLSTAVCTLCGRVTWRSGTEETQLVAKPIENVTFQLLDETNQFVDSEDISIVVYEIQLEETIQLSDGTQAVVKKALTITMLEDSTPVTLDNAVKLSIPMEDDLTGLKLLVMDENGELVEIAYEVVDGVMVFETDILGIFMLVQEI